MYNSPYGPRTPIPPPSKFQGLEERFMSLPAWGRFGLIGCNGLAVIIMAVITGVLIVEAVSPQSLALVSAQPPASSQVVQPTPTPAATQTKPTAQPTPMPSPIPVLAPTQTSDSVQQPVQQAQQPVPPPASSGGDKNCSDFATQEQAQAYFNSNGGSPSNDVDGLDRDHDGKACEDLPK